MPAPSNARTMVSAENPDAATTDRRRGHAPIEVCPSEEAGGRARISLPPNDHGWQALGQVQPLPPGGGLTQGKHRMRWDIQRTLALSSSDPRAVTLEYGREPMTSTKSRGALVAAILAALFVLLVVAPAVISLASGDGAICFASSACPALGGQPVRAEAVLRGGWKVRGRHPMTAIGLSCRATSSERSARRAMSSNQYRIRIAASKSLYGAFG